MLKFKLGRWLEGETLMYPVKRGGLFRDTLRYLINVELGISHDPILVILIFVPTFLLLLGVLQEVILIVVVHLIKLWMKKVRNFIIFCCPLFTILLRDNSTPNKNVREGLYPHGAQRIRTICLLNSLEHKLRARHFFHEFKRASFRRFLNNWDEHTFRGNSCWFIFHSCFRDGFRQIRRCFMDDGDWSIDLNLCICLLFLVFVFFIDEFRLLDWKLWLLNVNLWSQHQHWRRQVDSACAELAFRSHVFSFEL